MNLTVKTGDNVLVITGKDKGKSGKVTKVYAKEGKVLVENINIVTKHRKPRSQQDKGGIVKKPAPIQASNVMVICPVCGKATRIAHSEIDGKKVRICKKCKASVDKAYVKATKKEAKKAIKNAEELKSATLKQADKEEKVAEKPAVKKTTTKTASTKTASEKTTTTKKSTASTKKVSE